MRGMRDVGSLDVAKHAGDVADDHERARRERDGDLVRDGVCVDVVDLTFVIATKHASTDTECSSRSVSRSS